MVFEDATEDVELDFTSILVDLEVEYGEIKEALIEIVVAFDYAGVEEEMIKHLMIKKVTTLIMIKEVVLKNLRIMKVMVMDVTIMMGVINDEMVIENVKLDDEVVVVVKLANLKNVFTSCVEAWTQKEFSYLFD